MKQKDTKQVLIKTFIIFHFLLGFPIFALLAHLTHPAPSPKCFSDESSQLSCTTFMLLYDQNNHTSWTTHHMEEHYNKKHKYTW